MLPLVLLISLILVILVLILYPKIKNSKWLNGYVEQVEKEPDYSSSAKKLVVDKRQAEQMIKNKDAALSSQIKDAEKEKTVLSKEK